MSVQVITIRKSLDGNTNRLEWTTRFSKWYPINIIDIFPRKKGDTINYLLQKEIKKSIQVEAEYRKNCRFTRSRKAIIISKWEITDKDMRLLLSLYKKEQTKTSSLTSFIMGEGEKIDSFKLEGEKGEKTEMKISKDLYESPYLKADDLESNFVSTKIVGAQMCETIKDNHPDSAVGVQYSGMVKNEKGEIKFHILNKTNLRTLVAEYGEDTELWKNKPVDLMIVKANNPQTGKPVNTIQVAIPKKKAQKNE